MLAGSRSGENRRVVEAMWQAMSELDFERSGEFLHDDYVCEWPQSRERIRGRDSFVALNRNYPGEWRVTVERIVACGDEVVTDVALRWGEQTARAVSFFTLRNGKILKEVDYWPDPYDAPAWRAQWVELME